MKTYSCLIVDDEDLTLQRLEHFFSDKGLCSDEFRLVGKAYSGDEGIAEAIKLKPDIIITDIVMPGMDGIDMLEILKERLPRTKFIILSAFSVFHYAKRAIQINVTDYIVKVPLDDEKLLEALHKAASQLDETEQKEQKVQQLNMSILENRHRIRKQFFADLLNGVIGTQRVVDFASRHHLNFHPELYCCFVVEINDYNLFQSQYASSDQSILKYGISNILEETVSGYGVGFTSELEENRFIGFVSWPEVRSSSEFERRCRELGYQMNTYIKYYLKLSVSVGFSGMEKMWDSMVSAYEQARVACDDAYYWGAGLVVTPPHRLQYQDESAELFKPLLQGLLQKLNLDMHANELHESFSAIQAQGFEHKIRRKVMTGIIQDFLVNAKGKLRTMKPSLPGIGDRNLGFMTFREQLSFVKEHLEECLLEKNPYLRPEVVKAKQYIEQNLTKRLFLQELAEYVNLTPAYFSSLFKKEMNESLVEYITRRKIEKSLELLQHRDYTNQELCDVIGIVNEGYFCTVFKKVTGVSPQKYRKHLIQS
jgi:two-component system response regulator YesN